MMTKIPVAGVVWQTIHYLVGFQRLGFDPYYVEAHARTPGMLMRAEDEDSSALGAGFIRDTLARFGLDGRDILLELGRRRVVGGQEDMIVDVALELSKSA